jgi:uncharacterized protein
MSGLSISALYVYPIKSCGAVALASAQLVPGGFEYDRRYMLVDEAGRFISARTVPQLLQVQIQLKYDHEPAIWAQHPKLDAPLQLRASGPQVEQEIEVEVWRDHTLALLSMEGSEWFSAYLGREVRLVYLSEAHLRPVRREQAQFGDVVSFADGFPILLTSESSLFALNARLDSQIGMERFRPNLVVRGALEFQEDHWASLAVGEVEFDIPKLCDRCVMTTIDPVTLQSSKEPLRTLAEFRKWAGAVWFGANLIARGQGTLNVGDLVHVRGERRHPREAELQL